MNQDKKRNEKIIPSWLLKEETYQPPKGRFSSAKGTLLRIIHMFSLIRIDGEKKGSARCIPLHLLGTFYMIFLVSCSRNPFFVYCLFAALLLRLCFLPQKFLSYTVKTASKAMFFSMLFLFPSLLLGTHKFFLILCIKIFISVSIITLLSVSVSWNQLTSSLRYFHIPSIFIFTLDLTLHYIIYLSQISSWMLEALCLRSVGKENRKNHAWSGILGAVFLRTEKISKATNEAMRCRGFNGTYRKSGNSFFSLSYTDIFFSIGLLLMTLFFLYIERTYSL